MTVVDLRDDEIKNEMFNDEQRLLKANRHFVLTNVLEKDAFIASASMNPDLSMSCIGRGRVRKER